MVSVWGKKQKETFAPNMEEHYSPLSSSSCTHLEDFSGCLEKKAANNFRHFTSPNTTNYSVLFFSQTGSLKLSQQLLHSDIALSLSLSPSLSVSSSTPMPIVTSAAFWHKTAHYLPRGRLNSLPVSAKLSSCDQTATKLQSGVAPLLLNPLTWCPLQSTAILSTKTWAKSNLYVFSSFTKYSKYMSEAIEVFRVIRLAWDVPLSSSKTEAKLSTLFSLEKCHLKYHSFYAAQGLGGFHGSKDI